VTNTSKTNITDQAVSDYIAKIDGSVRKAEAASLTTLMTEITAQSPYMWGSSIIAFGTYDYVYESGRTGSAPILSFAPRKTQIVIYGLDVGSLAPDVTKNLGKHSTGKGCLYIQKLADIDLGVLRDILTAAWQKPRV
jgi:hypothetical protein